nr:MAG: putative RNA-dependent RNA polymerase [Mitoviridae sp.]
MLLFQHNQEGLERRLFIIGIPTYAIKPLVAEFVKWESCSGVEWTIARLKSLKVDLIRRKSHLEPKTWIRKNRSGDIGGVIGSLFRWSDKSDRNFKRCIQAFNAHTFYILPGLTEAQKVKFLSGINPDIQTDGLDPLFLAGFRRSVVRACRQRRITRCGSPLVAYQGSPEKKAPSYFGNKSVPQSEAILQELPYFRSPGGVRLYQEFRSLYGPLLAGLTERRFISHQARLSSDWWSRLGRDDGYQVRGGEIHFLQEPGGKLRSIASPFRIHQEALKPLGDTLYSVIKQLPWDCTFDQSKAIPHIQSCLRQGKSVHSVDLSSATDHFPLTLQVEALRALIHRDNWDHIDLFIKISRGKWKSPIGDLEWTKGQPLGLFPSFGAFTLTHGLLLNYLAGGDYRNQFFVVGDDVVILEDELKDRYISVLERMSCPYSADKSISSSQLAEFAGKIVTESWIIPQLKWRQMSSDNFLDLCRLLGKKSVCLLNSRQKRVFEAVAHLCEPIGLNMSLPGDSLETMIERTLAFHSPEKGVLGSLMGLRRRVHKVAYSSDSTFDPDEVKEILLTFDEKVKAVMRQSVFSNWRFLSAVGVEGFESIPEALETDPRLPLKGVTGNRVTTLERYERLLQLNGAL